MDIWPLAWTMDARMVSSVSTNHRCQQGPYPQHTLQTPSWPPAVAQAPDINMASCTSTDCEHQFHLQWIHELKTSTWLQTAAQITDMVFGGITQTTDICVDPRHKHSPGQQHRPQTPAGPLSVVWLMHTNMVSVGCMDHRGLTTYRKGSRVKNRRVRTGLRVCTGLAGVGARL